MMRPERGIVAAVVLYLVVALCQLALTPPFEAPDEGDHLAYANFVAQRLALPNQYDPASTLRGQGHQAPLYYVVAGLLIRGLMSDDAIDLERVPNPAHRWYGGTRLDVPIGLRPPGGYFRTPGDAVAFYGLRLLSVLFGLGTLWTVGGLARRLTDSEDVRAVAMLLLAGLPQFAFGSATVTADALTTLCCTLVAFHFAGGLRMPTSRTAWIWTGVALGLGLLTKKTALFLLPAMAVALGIAWLLRPADRGALARGGAVVVLLALALSEWLFARNYYLYGELLTATMEERTMPFLVAHKTLGDPYFRDVFPRLLGASFVGVFGWLSLWMPAPLYAAWATCGGLGLVGDVALGLRRRRATCLALGMLFGGACLGGVVYYNLTYNQPQGRYLLPVAGWLATLTAVGLLEGLARGRRSSHQAVHAAVATLAVVSQAIAVHATWTFYAVAGS